MAWIYRLELGQLVRVVPPFNSETTWGGHTLSRRRTMDVMIRGETLGIVIDHRPEDDAVRLLLTDHESPLWVNDWKCVPLELHYELDDEFR